MDDTKIFERIDTLVAEEHSLRLRRSQGDIDSDAERDRLVELEQTLDQCWDLLRRRRAARSVGADPDDTHAGSGNQVEGYLQ
ncbi:hypothetical protein CcI49_27070 [Frankia sp. CcI49]|uniref:DUF2630 domain-containing protein n=1 Tax=Parafrankia irregularis TaxID=795642 RepID=A0A0S4QE19_9ACTN|nr:MULTISPECIES: DUF2630 family protein [Frankiaceae]EFC85438.1 hypothetical protein FrEUN1fDRAFT_1425 [Parafrankia sp. EUN1f]KPM54987.1 hypothetical protein ACG83_16655 [Frankia sp. R43]MBE3199624.1 DUF2630 family protein [Parafrankia sp. CH37]ONH56139.1 hypothetical protein CcI49_27070 [Frankia sp. CcI49]CUU53709.1 Protein of unknown function (DUF2630) [Parafrankia irregularis]